jgi:hypothetical protein
MTHTARDLLEEAQVLRERGQAARSTPLFQAARRLAQRVGDATVRELRSPVGRLDGPRDSARAEAAGLAC